MKYANKLTLIKSVNTVKSTNGKEGVIEAHYSNPRASEIHELYQTPLVGFWVILLR